MWTGDIFIQVIERLQYLAMEPPELSVQFMNDMMINPTINFTPIRVLLPIPDNYIQKQAILEVRSKEEKEEEKKPEIKKPEEKIIGKKERNDS